MWYKFSRWGITDTTAHFFSFLINCCVFWKYISRILFSHLPMEILAIYYISSVLFICRNLFLVTHWDLSKLSSFCFLFTLVKTMIFSPLIAAFYILRGVSDLFYLMQENHLNAIVYSHNLVLKRNCLATLYFQELHCTKSQWIWCFFHILGQKKIKKKHNSYISSHLWEQHMMGKHMMK